MRLLLMFSIVIISLSSCGDNYEIKYYENGNVMYKARKTNGLFDGDFVTFYQDGKLKSKGYWIKGIGNGCIERFFQNGKIEERATYKNGKLDGKIEVYYSSGQKRLESYYTNGLKTGEYRVFEKNGFVSERHIFTSKGELFYLVKFGGDSIKELELFFPTFLKREKSDSLEVVVTNNIKFKGEAKLSIGLRTNDKLEVLCGPKIIVDSVPNSLLVGKDIDVDNLYYRFEFTPSEIDTLNGFLIEKRIFEGGDTENLSANGFEDFI